MTDGEGLSVRDAVEWCGGVITINEATRLWRLVRAQASDDGPVNGIRRRMIRVADLWPLDRAAPDPLGPS
jgi:hypothetical protein